MHYKLVSRKVGDIVAALGDITVEMEVASCRKLAARDDAYVGGGDFRSCRAGTSTRGRCGLRYRGVRVLTGCIEAPPNVGADALYMFLM